MNEWVIAVPLIGLVLVMAGHIVGMARWSGKVDTKLEMILTQPSQWTSDLNAVAAAFRIELASSSAALKVQIEAALAEIKTLRDARHDADGTIAIHEGQLREIEKRFARLESRSDLSFRS